MNSRNPVNLTAYANIDESECFVGNTLHNPVKASPSQCNMVCAGSYAELCGGTSRVQIYQDTTWSEPDVQQLIDLLKQYNSTLKAAQDALVTYQGHLKQYKADGGASITDSKMKRQLGSPLTPALRADYVNLKGDFSLIPTFQQQLGESMAPYSQAVRRFLAYQHMSNIGSVPDQIAAQLVRNLLIAMLQDLPAPLKPIQGIPVKAQTIESFKTEGLLVRGTVICMAELTIARY